ncbi:MAG TPA: DUF4249 family protein [bacterium]
MNRMVVLAVLSPDFERQTIILYQGINQVYTDGLPIGGVDQPIRHARVVVSSENQVVNFAETAPGEYRDVVIPLFVEPGKTYFLQVTASDGQTVQARTTVPSPVHFLRPEDNLEVTDSTFVEFIWTESPGVAVCTFDWRRPCEHRNYSRIGDPVHSNRVVVLVLNWSFCDVGPWVHTFRVSALDSAFANYVDAFPNGTTNIENGAGVFGSMVSDSLTITVFP